jgi:hypothetical protein
MSTRAFLAHCSCHGDTCTCHYDGHHLKSIHSKGNPMFEHMSASDRKNRANRILELPADQQPELVSQLSGVIDKISAAEASSERKKAALERIAAAKPDAFGGKAAINLLNGTLKRGNLPSVEELAEKKPDEILKLFAASSMSNYDKIAAKSTLSKLKVID